MFPALSAVVAKRFAAFPEDFIKRHDLHPQSSERMLPSVGFPRAPQL